VTAPILGRRCGASPDDWARFPGSPVPNSKIMSRWPKGSPAFSGAVHGVLHCAGTREPQHEIMRALVWRTAMVSGVPRSMGGD
jgi:hypothetical protein